MGQAQREGNTEPVGVALVSLALLAASSLLPADQFFFADALIAGAAGLVLSWALWRARTAANIALVSSVICALHLTSLPWPLSLLIPLGLSHACAQFVPELRPVWFTRGRVPLAATVVCGAVTPFALVTWLALAHADLSDLLQQVPKAAPWLLVLGGVGFAALNASLEEWVWRGVIQTRIAALASERVAIGVQAVSFGVAHAHGFPRGASGMALAGIWALMLGLLRKRSSGLLAPTLAHFVADETIVVLLLQRAA